MTAAQRWREALESWAIPQAILDAAPASPWGFDTSLFTRRAESALSELTVSTDKALQTLPAGGTVLDVGCGAGAASLPLAGRAGRLIGVDASARMLDAFRERALSRGCAVDTFEGRWPEVADGVPAADVVVCHHVAYNAPDLAAFAARLTDHARRRVVVELTRAHPQSRLNPMWLRVHNVVRPTEPTADDAAAVLRELGLDVEREDWEPTAMWLAGFSEREELLARVRRGLCLPAERDPDVWAAMADLVVERDGRFSLPMQPVVTLWWDC